MEFNSLLNNTGVLANILLGLLGLVLPGAAARLISLEPQGLRGLSEIRATYGGVFLGLGGFALWSQNRMVFVAVGLAWVCAALARLLSVLIDKSRDKMNLGGVVFEGVVGALLLANF